MLPTKPPRINARNLTQYLGAHSIYDKTPTKFSSAHPGRANWFTTRVVAKWELSMRFRIMRTESEADLANLQAEILGDFRPTDFVERELVKDVIHHTWNMRRYRRVETGIQENALRSGLAQILNEILLPPSTANADRCLISSQSLSHGWLLGPEDRQVASLLKEAGLDESSIEAKAYTLVADDLEKAKRMSESAREGRDKALRSLAKYRKSLAEHLRQNSDRVLAADQAPSIADGEKN